VAINGSPRKGGNTETLLREALKPLDEAGWSTSLIQLGGAKIKGCAACYKCFENKDRRCAVVSDALNPILELMLEADAILLGTPTYFSSVSAEMKALIDRAGLVSYANGRLLAGKIGAAVVAVRRGGGTHAFEGINNMFLFSGMIVPGSIYPNLGYGLGPGEVANDAEGMRNVRHLGRVIAWLGVVVKPHLGTRPMPEAPEEEQR